MTIRTGSKQSQFYLVTAEEVAEYNASYLQLRFDLSVAQLTIKQKEEEIEYLKTKLEEVNADEV